MQTPADINFDALADRVADRLAGAIASRIADRILESAELKARAAALAGDDALVDEDEAAAILASRPKTLQHWRQIGAGPRVAKIGSRIGYRLGDLKAYIRESAGINPRARLQPVIDILHTVKTGGRA